MTNIKDPHAKPFEGILGYHYRMSRIKNLFKKLLHIEDTPERTALAYSIGIFLGFSPFLGFHTLGGIAVAFLFGLNRIAVLLGVWSNTPWWIVPYYGVATWLGMWLTGFQFERESLEEMFRLGMEKGFLRIRFLGVSHLPMGFSHLLCHRVFGLSHPSQFSPLSSFSEGD